MSVPQVEALTRGHAIAEQILAAGRSLTLELDEGAVTLTGLERIVWPAGEDRPDVTKREFLAYLAAVSPWLLPHVRDRIVTLAGYRRATSPPLYFQRHRDHVPAFVETVRVYAESHARDQTNVLCNNLATLLWLGQINNLAVHVSLFRVREERSGSVPSFTGSKEAVERSVLHRPDFLLFDLDPYLYSGEERRSEPPRLHRAGWERACDTARALKALLDSVPLPSFVKTSGATGLHVVVPVTRSLDFDATTSVCDTFAAELERRDGGVTRAWSVSDRRGKVFIDCRQNGYTKSIAAPYSPRAQPAATVSMPVEWEELNSIYPTDFTFATVLRRLTDAGDPWAGLLERAVDLPAVVDNGPGA